MLYLDTSALAKRYLQEKGSQAVDDLCHNNQLTTSRLSYAEIYAAFYRTYRDNLIDLTYLTHVVSSFEKDWQSLLITDFTPAIATHIPPMAKRFALAGADSIHLATATHLLDKGLSISFVTSDKRLFNAAKDYGLEVIDPVDGG